MALLRPKGDHSAWTEKAAKVLVALYIREKRWSDAADVIVSSMNESLKNISARLLQALSWRFSVTDDAVKPEEIPSQWPELLAECLFRADRFNELESLPSPTPRIRFWQGASYACQGRREEALAVWREVLDKQPNFGQRARPSLISWARLPFLPRQGDRLEVSRVSVNGIAACSRWVTDPE